jgi:hypothetical protein
MITLITATPGSGKTLWAIKEIFARVNESEPWNIFTNIDGIKLDTAQPLKDKFTDYPPRSLVVIDEAQKITHFSKKYKHPIKNQNHSEVEFLQTHRHAEFLDIIYITQAPRLLNPDVLDMVGTHYHLHRPMGLKMATWWMWKYHQLNPNAKSVKADAEDTGTFTYPKHLFGMYKSSDGGDDSHGKIKIPMKIINAIWMLVLVLGISGWLYMKQRPSDQTQQEQKKQETTKTDSQQQPIATTGAIANLEQECRKGSNVEKPECVQWFNQLSLNKSSVQDQRIDYDASKPFDVELKNADYTVTSKPVFSGCTKFGNHYQAYTQQGTKLDVSQSDCERLIKNNDRPFNYFAQNQNVQQQAPVAEMQNSNVLAQSQTNTSIDSKQLELISDSNQANNVIVETRTLGYSKDIHHIN